MMLPPSAINTMKRTPGPEELLESDVVLAPSVVITDFVRVTVLLDELVTAIVHVVTLSLHSSKTLLRVPGTVQLNLAVSDPCSSIDIERIKQSRIAINNNSQRLAY